MLPLFLAVAAAQPSPLHTYQDWIVGCDNVRACQANALASQGDDGDYLRLDVVRDGRPKAGATLSVPLPDGASAGARFSLKVDGAQVATFAAHGKTGPSLPLSGGLLAALRNGRHAALFDSRGKKVSEASLAGLAAALRYIDDRQGRVGAVGALIATGPKPITVIRAPPPYPVIVTPSPSAKPPRGIGDAEATRLIGDDNAACGDDANGKVNPRAYRLDAAHSLVLVDHPCGNGAYNYFTSVFVLGETGRARAALFDNPPGMGEQSKDGTGVLTNGDWNAKTRRLSSFERGRGLADCGTTESYVWDGARFRLLEANEMDECRGSVDYIRTWTARVGG